MAVGNIPVVWSLLQSWFAGYMPFLLHRTKVKMLKR